MELTAIHKHLPPTNAAAFGTKAAQDAAAFHRTLPDYAPTPLHALSGLAEALGIAALFVKDESSRFGLNAFKGLGGSFAMHRLAEGKAGAMTFVTATDGNHGRGIAWAAQRLGYKAHVYLPRGTARERLDNIRALGAEAEILELSYDDTVRFAARMAEERGWILIQDTAWDGYEEIPALIMQGYTTMGLEITAQLGGRKPTHIFLQAGVGAMAGAMAAFFADHYGTVRPTAVIVEPEGANCIFRTAKADDGALHFCPDSKLRTMMAGLCCGEPCTIGWEMLRSHADFVLSCGDETAVLGMRTLGLPLPGDAPIVSGESGAVTVGALTELMRSAALLPLRQQLGLNESSVVLCISTEGDTDRENYRRILSGT